MYAIGGEAEGTPNHVKYHNATDLQRITKIDFPDVVLVDSAYYESFSLQVTTEKFVLKDKKNRSQLLRAIENGKYWKENDEGYRFYILPEDGIEDTKELNWRKTQDGKDDWDGSFIEIIVPSLNDTITVKYGWAR